MDVDIRVFDLPPLEPENYSQIEARVNQLHSRYRDKKKIDEIELDWLDTANNWLLTH